MPAILPSVKIDSDSMLAEYFMPPQIAWILAEDELHAQNKQACILAEKSARIGWTFCDGFKNVRKRLRFRDRPYLFATKDYPSAIEYMRMVYAFADLLDYTGAIIAHGEAYMKVDRLDPAGKPTIFTDEIKIGYIKFDNDSYIRAFSAHPQAMSVYGGDVGLDEFAKHPNAQLLWQTAQARVTWGFDLAIWSSHEGDDTLFNQFAQEARALCPGGTRPASPTNPSTSIENPKSKIENPSGPWNRYFRVTLLDAIENGLLDKINETRGTALTKDQFIADCKARAGLDEIFQQTYMCNPVPAGASIVEWSAIERCRADYQIERVHLESEEIPKHFGDFVPGNTQSRETTITNFLKSKFPALLSPSDPAIENRKSKIKNPELRLGFDVAASGQGHLAVFYIDEPKGPELWLRALLSARTEDWHFLKTVLFFFLNLPNLRGAGDETSLGRQICWEARQRFSSRFLAVNFSAKKQDLGFALMNQLSAAEKRFPQSEQDIAADYFALRKHFTGNKWTFTEGRNTYNPASHCDIAWAGALASEAHTRKKPQVWAYAG